MISGNSICYFGKTGNNTLPGYTKGTALNKDTSLLLERVWNKSGYNGLLTNKKERVSKIWIFWVNKVVILGLIFNLNLLEIESKF